VSDEAEREDDASLRVVRLGHGANCSSIGSVVDTLFISAAVGGAILAAVFAAMKTEPVRVVGERPKAKADDDEEAS